MVLFCQVSLEYGDQSHHAECVNLTSASNEALLFQQDESSEPLTVQEWFKQAGIDAECKSEDEYFQHIKLAQDWMNFKANTHLSQVVDMICNGNKPSQEPVQELADTTMTEAADNPSAQQKDQEPADGTADGTAQPAAAMIQTQAHHHAAAATDTQADDAESHRVPVTIISDKIRKPVFAVCVNLPEVLQNPVVNLKGGRSVQPLYDLCLGADYTIDEQHRNLTVAELCNKAGLATKFSHTSMKLAKAYAATDGQIFAPGLSIQQVMDGVVNDTEVLQGKDSHWIEKSTLELGDPIRVIGIRQGNTRKDWYITYAMWLRNVPNGFVKCDSNFEPVPVENQQTGKSGYMLLDPQSIVRKGEIRRLLLAQTLPHNGMQVKAWYPGTPLSQVQQDLAKEPSNQVLQVGVQEMEATPCIQEQATTTPPPAPAAQEQKAPAPSLQELDTKMEDVPANMHEEDTQQQQQQQQPEDGNRAETESHPQTVRKGLRSANKATSEKRAAAAASPASCGTKRMRTDGDASTTVVRLKPTDKVPVTATTHDQKPPVTVLGIWKNPVELLDSEWKGGRPIVAPIFDNCLNDEFEVDPTHTDLKMGELMNLYPLRSHFKLTSIRIAKDMVSPDGQVYPAGLSIWQVVEGTRVENVNYNSKEIHTQRIPLSSILNKEMYRALAYPCDQAEGAQRVVRFLWVPDFGTGQDATLRVVCDSKFAPVTSPYGKGQVGHVYTVRSRDLSKEGKNDKMVLAQTVRTSEGVWYPGTTLLQFRRDNKDTSKLQDSSKTSAQAPSSSNIHSQQGGVSQPAHEVKTKIEHENVEEPHGARQAKKRAVADANTPSKRPRNEREAGQAAVAHTYDETAALLSPATRQKQRLINHIAHTNTAAKAATQPQETEPVTRRRGRPARSGTERRTATPTTTTTITDAATVGQEFDALLPVANITLQPAAGGSAKKSKQAAVKQQQQQQKQQLMLQKAMNVPQMLASPPMMLTTPPMPSSAKLASQQQEARQMKPPVTPPTAPAIQPNSGAAVDTMEVSNGTMLPPLHGVSAVNAHANEMQQVALQAANLHAAEATQELGLAVADPTAHTAYANANNAMVVYQAEAASIREWPSLPKLQCSKEKDSLSLQSSQDLYISLKALLKALQAPKDRVATLRDNLDKSFGPRSEDLGRALWGYSDLCDAVAEHDIDEVKKVLSEWPFLVQV